MIGLKVRVILFVLGAALSLPAPVVQAQGRPTCPDALLPRLTVGGLARVTPGEPNIVRASPATAGVFVTNIPGGAELVVLDGPACADGYAWWKIIYEGVVGWTAEAGAAYWLEPVTDNLAFGVPVTVDAQGITLIYHSGLGSPVQAVFLPEGADPTAREVLEFRFERFVVANEAETVAAVRIYPAAVFARRYRTLAENTFAWLNEETTVLPIGPQAEVRRDKRTLVARAARLDFAGGRGLRMITFTGREGERVDSFELTYEFFGQTSDGQMVVTAAFPVLAPPLDALRDPGVDFAAYLRGIAIVLDATRSSDFAPNLDYLDALLLSLRVDAAGWE